VRENVKEAKELSEASHQYACEGDNLKLFRKENKPKIYCLSKRAGDGN
jgi:hypothetical protein